jgi:hypothetical protein
MLHILNAEQVFSILGRLTCRVNTFDTTFEDTNSTTKFSLFSGSAKINEDSISGVVASVTTGPIQISGKGIVITTPGYTATEEKICKFDPTKPGQLSYIDGCSNTNLVDPPRNGDPCINYLYFPENIKQTYHTHPSIRIGIVLTGNGIASVNKDEIELHAGSMFVLDRHTLHRFYTVDSSMSLMVFHPDSEDGPTDQFNPMKSRTYLSE